MLLGRVAGSGSFSYPANSNMAEIQFDVDFETKEYDAEQDSEEAPFGIIFSEALSTKKSFCSH